MTKTAEVNRIAIDPQFLLLRRRARAGPLIRLAIQTFDPTILRPRFIQPKVLCLYQVAVCCGGANPILLSNGTQAHALLSRVCYSLNPLLLRRSTVFGRQVSPIQVESAALASS